ncbi:MAG: hypothetical protein Q8S84_08435 [bacterium]|nr:hypothetical protein [bacterium]MDP3381462.1 hypothetical protein [bacterium]
MSVVIDSQVSYQVLHQALFDQTPDQLVGFNLLTYISVALEFQVKLNQNILAV